MVLYLVGYFVFVRYVHPSLVFVLGCGTPVTGGAVAAYLAPKAKFWVGMATFFPALVLNGVGGYLGGLFGFGDNIGAEGTIIAMVISVPIIGVCSVVGSLIGKWASGRVQNA